MLYYFAVLKEAQLCFEQLFTISSNTFFEDVSLYYAICISNLPLYTKLIFHANSRYWSSIFNIFVDILELEYKPHILKSPTFFFLSAKN